MKSFYPKGNWVKWKSRIEESVESLIKWAFEKTVNKSWQNRWECNLYRNLFFRTTENTVFIRNFPILRHRNSYRILAQNIVNYRRNLGTNWVDDWVISLPNRLTKNLHVA